MIRNQKILSSVVLLIILNLLLGIPSIPAANGVLGVPNAIATQSRSGDGPIMISVLNSCTNQLIPGAVVTIGELHYVTNAFGSTTIPVQPSGSIVISVDHSGYYDSSLLAASSNYPATYLIFLVPLKPCYL
jgi:hypothetical protein